LDRQSSKPSIAPVDTQFDDRPAAAASLESPAPHRRRSSRGYTWKFWTFDWGTPRSGEHKIRSRAFDVYGNAQPAPDDPFLASKRTYWESNEQITRRVLIH
jgi:hypothetical protein